MSSGAKAQRGWSDRRTVFSQQRNVTQAELTHMQAQVNYVKSLVDYDKAVGRTLRKNNIKIEKEIKIAVE